MPLDLAKYPLAWAVHAEQKSPLTRAFSDPLPQEYNARVIRAAEIIEATVDASEKDQVLAAYMLTLSSRFSLNYRFKFNCPKEIRNIVDALVRGRSDDRILLQGAALFWIVTNERSEALARQGIVRLLQPSRVLPPQLQELWAVQSPLRAILADVAPKLFALLTAADPVPSRPKSSAVIIVPTPPGPPN